MNNHWRMSVLCILLAWNGSAVAVSGFGKFGVQSRVEKAVAMWQERCKKSGEFIYRKATDVAGIMLLKLRPSWNPWDQYLLSDPYGTDLSGEGYIQTFLRGDYRANNTDIPEGDPPRRAYHWVDAVDPKDGVLYRYTGEIVEPWIRDKSFLKGYRRFEMRRTPALGLQPVARYGVTFDDISTREERDYWIAGSSLRVVDITTGEIMAERIGYMLDVQQGNQAGGRQPWSYAADNACPRFDRNRAKPMPRYLYQAQPYQSLDFVEKVLRPLE